MKWINFSDRWPPQQDEEILVRSPSIKEIRTVRRTPPTLGFPFMFSDCTHPLQNCYFSTEQAQWLDD